MPVPCSSSHLNNILLLLIPHSQDDPTGNKGGKALGLGNFLRGLVRKGLGFSWCGERAGVGRGVLHMNGNEKVWEI